MSATSDHDAQDRSSSGSYARGVTDIHEPEHGTGAQGPDGQASLSDLISRLGDDVTLLFRQEVELAKVEVRRELVTAGKAGGLLAAAGILGLVTLLLIAWAIAWGLAAVMQVGLAFLLTGLLFGLVAAGLGMAGKKRFEQVDPTPRTTMQTLKEDKEWLTERTTS